MYSAGEKRKLEFWKQITTSIVGVGLFNFLGGLMVGQYSENDHSGPDYSPLFYLLMTVTFLDILVLTTLMRLGGSDPEVKEEKDGNNRVKKSLALLKNPKVVLFIVWCMTVSTCGGIIVAFQLWYLDDLMVVWKGCRDVYSIKVLQGLSLLVQSFLGEIPFLFFSGEII